MSADFSKNFFVSSVVSDLFTIESILCSTRTADLFKAFDRERGRPVAVWMLRNQFDPGAEEIINFSNRLAKIASLSGRVAKILTAGVDPSGVVFSVVGPLDGYPILGGNLDPVEAERRFIAALKLIEVMHNNGIACGDISSASFWVNRAGEINFVGIMGSYERDDRNSPVPPVESIHYLAPEQTIGSNPTPLHDVYALGVLGYQLFTRDFPPREATGKISIRELVPTAPPWVDEVIQRCLDVIPNRRYSSASSMIQGVSDTKEKIIKEQSAVTQKRESGVTERVNQESGVVSFEASKTENETPPRVTRSLSTKQLMLIGGIAAFCMAVIVVGGFLVIRNVGEPAPAADIELQTHREAADDKLRKAIDVLQEDDAETKEVRAKFQELQDSDDPLAHEVLVRGAIDTQNTKIRLIAERAITSRARRLKLNESVNAVQKWLDLSNVVSPPPEYPFVLKSIDPTLPIEGRKAALRRIFELTPDLAIVIASGLTLDSEDPQSYHDLISEFIGASLKLTQVQNRSALTLMVLHPAIFQEFRESIQRKIPLIPDDDLRWLLERLLEQGSPNVYYIASVAIERRVFPPYKLVYLEPLRDRTELPEGIPSVLVRATNSQLSVGDLELLGSWFDELAQRVLFAICADEITDELRVEAFEYLAGRGLSMQPAGDFVTWVKNSHWDRRLELARPAGILALAELMTAREIKEGFAVLKNYAQDDELFEILFDSTSSTVTQVVLKEFENSIPVRGVIKLLANPDKEVRISAVRTLKHTNDVSALKAIIALYEAEIDPDVKAAYKEHLWVIQQRSEVK